MKNIKIASLFESLKIGGGVERIQADLSIGLANLGYEFIHLVLQDKEPRNNYQGKIVSLGEQFVFGFGIRKIISLFRIAWKVKQYCQKEKVDILIGQGDFFFMVSGLARLMGNPTKNIAVVMTTIGIWNMIVNKILRFFLSYHDRIIFLSYEEKEIFINIYGFDSKKLFVISPSVDIKKIIELSNEPIQEDNILNRFTFISIGRLTYQKGQDRLIQAFNKLYKKIQHIQLVILGDGELKNYYNTMIKEYHDEQFEQCIHLLGNKSNVYKYLKHANCFVLSSHFEGFAVVIIEAMACELPVISTNCPTGPSEILGNSNGTDYYHEYGILIDYKLHTVENLYTSMYDIYSNEQLRKHYVQQSKSRSMQYHQSSNIKKRDDLIISLMY